MITEPTKDASIRQSPKQIFWRFLRFGFLAWGGPVAQIAMLRQELVEEEKWVTKDRFNRALAVYQVLPGPEAHEMCVWFGMMAGGRLGGFLAGLGFMLPGFLLMLALTWLYVQFGIESSILLAVFSGFQAAVIALIFAAVHRIGKHVLVNLELFTVALLSAVATFSSVGFFIVLPLVAVAYVLWMKKNKPIAVFLAFLLLAFSLWTFSPEVFQPELTVAEEAVRPDEPHDVSPWLVFYTGLKGGLLTFGGAYTVIPFIQQDAVINNDWMSNGQFLDGIALSGILPAPLIIFSTFVGYFAGGWLGAIVITVGIFLPAFCFTLLGHNLLDKVIENRALHNFLDGVAAGVIGLIAITAIQLFRTTINNWFALTIFSMALIVLYQIKSKFTVIFVILGAGLLGLLYYQIS